MHLRLGLESSQKRRDEREFFRIEADPETLEVGRIRAFLGICPSMGLETTSSLMGKNSVRTSHHFALPV